MLCSVRAAEDIVTFSLYHFSLQGEQVVCNRINLGLIFSIRRLFISISMRNILLANFFQHFFSLSFIKFSKKTKLSKVLVWRCFKSLNSISALKLLGISDHTRYFKVTRIPRKQEMAEDNILLYF